MKCLIHCVFVIVSARKTLDPLQMTVMFSHLLSWRFKSAFQKFVERNKPSRTQYFFVLSLKYEKNLYFRIKTLKHWTVAWRIAKKYNCFKDDFCQCRIGRGYWPLTSHVFA